jgi:MFS family permease
MTFNTSANQTVQLATDPVMRGRVMSLYMMVFFGGTPIGGPVMGWVTDSYGARIGFLAGGLISAGAALGVGLVLARAAGLRPQVSLRRGKGRPLVSFVPRGTGSGPLTGLGSGDGSGPLTAELDEPLQSTDPREPGEFAEPVADVDGCERNDGAGPTPRLTAAG